MKINKTAFQESCTHSKIPTACEGKYLFHKILWEHYYFTNSLIFKKLETGEGSKKDKTGKSADRTASATLEDNTEGDPAKQAEPLGEGLSAASQGNRTCSQQHRPQE